jgi:TonB family protein
MGIHIFRTFRRVRQVAFLMFLATAWSAGVSLADFQDEIVNLSVWSVAKTGSKFATRGNELRVSGGRGWVRTDTVFLDFILRLEYRIAKKDAEAGVVLRAVVARPDSWPVGGYRVSVRQNRLGEQHAGAVTSYKGKVRALEASSTVNMQAEVSAEDDWQQLEIRCDGDRLTVRLNGSVINDVQGTEWLAGYIGIEGVRGDVEFRNMSLTKLRTGLMCGDDHIKDELARFLPANGNGIVPPHVRLEVRPHYTAEAMQRMVQGMVLLDFVIEADGSVGVVCLRRGLDPDLDVEALATVRRWRFQPATRNDQPVPVRATIELNFTLR